MITITKVWNHGDAKDYKSSKSDKIIDWFNMILHMQPAKAIFINGKCVHTGILGKEKCEELEKTFR